jgi:hypothetical protein
MTSVQTPDSAVTTTAYIGGSVSSSLDFSMAVAPRGSYELYFVSAACQFNTTVIAAPPGCAGVAIRNRWPSFETSYAR